MSNGSSSTPNPGLAHAESGTSPPNPNTTTTVSPPYLPANVAMRRPTDPDLLAQRYLQTTGRDPQGRLTVHFWRGEWWRYSAGRYSVIPDKELRGELAAFIQCELERENAIDRSGFRPVVRGAAVSDVMLQLQGRTQLAGEQEQPFGIGLLKGETGFIAFQNGLYRPDPNGKPGPLPPTPDWFSPNCLPYDYNPKAECPRFEQFLSEILPSNPDVINLVQEIFGYCLVPTPASRSSSCFRARERTGRACYWTR